MNNRSYNFVYIHMQIPESWFWVCTIRFISNFYALYNLLELRGLESEIQRQNNGLNKASKRYVRTKWCPTKRYLQALELGVKTTKPRRHGVNHVGNLSDLQIVIRWTTVGRDKLYHGLPAYLLFNIKFCAELSMQDELKHWMQCPKRFHWKMSTAFLPKTS